MDSEVTIDPSATLVDLADLLGEGGVFSVSFGGRAILPIVVATPGNLQYPAQ
jgi:hypothetical protein